MKLKFLGGAGEVGRSCILLESNGTKILLDAGIKLGEKVEYPQLSDSEIKELDAIVITHAHLDHSGYLPHIFSSGWRGYVYSTKPTFELSNVLISDYLRISKPSSVTKEGMSQMQKHFKLVEYHKPFNIKNLTLKLLPAGHIVGSAMIEVNDGSKTLIYTGDVNMRSTRLLDPAYTENLHADALIMESTYGGDKDALPTENALTSKMLASIKETISKGGKIIIPSFGVGRAQEVLLMLDAYISSGVLPKVPIYIDGMISKAMRIHRHNVIYCRDELQKRILMSEDDPFKSSNFNPVEGVAQRKSVMSSPEPSIIVTTSGMITGGPIIRYLMKLAGNSNNKLILVGYQAEGTKGRALAEGAKELKINGKNIKINMSVEAYHLSAHADRMQLLKLVSKIARLKEIFIVHGEAGKSNQLYETLKHKYTVYLPKIGESFELN